MTLADSRASETDEFQPENRVAIGHLGAHGLVCAAVVWWMLVADFAAVAMGVAPLLLGYMLARGLEIAHALIHGRFFTKDYAHLNRWVGCLLTAPFLLSWTQWRWTHLRHHIDPQIEGFDYPDVRSIRDVPALICHHLMMPHWQNALKRTWWAWTSPERLSQSLTDVTFGRYVPNPKTLKHIKTEYRINSIALLAIAALLTATGGLPIALLTLVWASIIHVLIEFPEHVLADLESPNAELNSYEISDCSLCDLFSMNNSRHATHHRFPGVPIYHLPRLSRALDHPHGSATYAGFWKAFFTTRIRRSKADGAS